MTAHLSQSLTECHGNVFFIYFLNEFVLNLQLYVRASWISATVLPSGGDTAQHTQ